jgi:hypothetical protein
VFLWDDFGDIRTSATISHEFGHTIGQGFDGDDNYDCDDQGLDDVMCHTGTAPNNRRFSTDDCIKIAQITKWNNIN